MLKCTCVTVSVSVSVSVSVWVSVCVCVCVCVCVPRPCVAGVCVSVRFGRRVGKILLRCFPFAYFLTVFGSDLPNLDGRKLLRETATKQASAVSFGGEKRVIHVDTLDKVGRCRYDDKIKCINGITPLTELVYRRSNRTTTSLTIPGVSDLVQRTRTKPNTL